MIVNSTEVKAYLNLSIYSTIYDTSIDRFIPVVQENIINIANHRYRDAYHSFNNEYVTFSSTAKTITLGGNSTVNYQEKYKTGDTIDIYNSYYNDGFLTITAVNSSYSITVSENIIDENSSNYDRNVYFYRCHFDRSIKAIASKMVWYNITNSTNINGNIQSESLGNYSVTYAKDANIVSQFGYPDSIISGIKRKVRAW